MKHLGLPLVDAYLIVRSRRLSVLIQPNMRLLYNLCGWEVTLARERAGDDEEQLKYELARTLSWPYLAREVHSPLNRKSICIECILLSFLYTMSHFPPFAIHFPLLLTVDVYMKRLSTPSLHLPCCPSFLFVFPVSSFVSFFVFWVPVERRYLPFPSCTFLELSQHLVLVLCALVLPAYVL